MTLRTKSKQFDRALHDASDIPARDAVRRFYATLGVVLHDNPDPYGIDLITEDGKVLVEVERRMVWDKPEFPFVEVNFLQRKVKFFTGHAEGVLVDYAIVSNDFKKVGIIDRQSIVDIVIDTEPEESPNRYVNDSEFFYKIPRSAFKWFDVL